MIEINQNLEKELETDELVLVDFWATWCGPCKTLKPILAKLEDKVKICMVDVDKNPDLASEHNITSLPAMAFFKKGKEVDRLVGLRPQGLIETVIDKYK